MTANAWELGSFLFLAANPLVYVLGVSLALPGAAKRKVSSYLSFPFAGGSRTLVFQTIAWVSSPAGLGGPPARGPGRYGAQPWEPPQPRPLRQRPPRPGATVTLGSSAPPCRSPRARPPAPPARASASPPRLAPPPQVFWFCSALVALPVVRAQWGQPPGEPDAGDAQFQLLAAAAGVGAVFSLLFMLKSLLVFNPSQPVRLWSGLVRGREIVSWDVRKVRGRRRGQRGAGSSPPSPPLGRIRVGACQLARAARRPAGRQGGVHAPRAGGMGQGVEASSPRKGRFFAPPPPRRRPQLPSRSSASTVVAGMGLVWAMLGSALLLATEHYSDATSR